MNEQQFLNRCASDFWFFAGEVLTILVQDERTGHESMRLFRHPRDEQRAIVEWAVWCIQNGVPVRVIIDKCRDLGMSTVIWALAYWLACLRPHFQALLIAQQKDSTRKIAELGQRFVKHMPAHFREGDLAEILLPKSVGNGLFWANDAMIEWITQRSEDTTRGSRPRFVHASEFGSWHKKREGTSEKEVLASLLGSWSLVPGTFLFFESTAQGPMGDFYDRWKTAEREWCAAGNSVDYREPQPNKRGVPGHHCVWRPFFFSWQGVPKFTIDVRPEVEMEHNQMLQLWESGKHQKAFKLATNLGYVREELDGGSNLWMDRIIDHNLRATETAWAVAKLAEYNWDLDIFDREHPLTWELSFQTSGRPVFNQRRVEWLMNQPRPDMLVGATLDAPNGQPSIADALRGAGGQWEIYKPPVAGHEYVIGTDSGAGIKDGDYSTIEVFDRTTREFVAEFYDRLYPQRQALEVMAAGRWYNDALINPEVNNDGRSLLITMWDHGYPHIMLRNPHKPMPEGAPVIQTHGSVVSESNRKDLYNLLRYELFKPTEPGQGARIYSHRTLREMKTCHYDKNERPDHMPGYYDDGVFGHIHALEADRALGEMYGLTEPEVRTHNEQQTYGTARTQKLERAVRSIESGRRRAMRQPRG